MSRFNQESVRKLEAYKLLFKVVNKAYAMHRKKFQIGTVIGQIKKLTVESDKKLIKYITTAFLIFINQTINPRKLL